MNQPLKPLPDPNGKKIVSVLLFWAGYLAITLTVGFVTSMLIPSSLLQLIAWGVISSLLLLVLSRLMGRQTPFQRPTPAQVVHTTKGCLVGLAVGMASFGFHIAVVSTLAGPIRFEWVPGVGLGLVVLFFVRFMATSAMEEIGFRGTALRTLEQRLGTWPAVIVTSVAFGLSHLSYGWDLGTIFLGVVPCGIMWGVSAVATRGIAVPIGLHAAWNFSAWTSGSRAETGLLKMVIEDDVLERTQWVATVSYLATFGLLTVGFWLIHRRNMARAETDRP